MLVGKATYADQGASDYDRYATILGEIAEPDFPILGVIAVNVRHIEPILSPSYRVFPKRTDTERIALAMQEYGVQPQESSQG